MMMSTCSPAASANETGEISGEFDDILRDPSNPIEEVRKRVHQHKMSGHLDEFLFDILAIVSAFVTAPEHPRQLVRRLLACGYMRVANVLFLSTNALAAYIAFSRQGLNAIFGRLNWIVESQAKAYAKIVSGAYFPEYPGIFTEPMMSQSEFRRFTFRIRLEDDPEAHHIYIMYKGQVWEQEVQATEDIKERIDDIMADLCATDVPRNQTRMKILNLTRGYRLLEKELKAVKARLAEYEIQEVVNDETDEDSVVSQSEDVPVDAIPADSPSIQQSLLNELNQLIELPKCRRRYSENIWKISFLLDRTSGLNYRVVCVLLPFPADRSVRGYWAPQRLAIMANLQGSGLQSLEQLVSDYRRLWNLGEECLPCTLAFDATSVTKTGIQDSKKPSEFCFAYMVLPLHCDFPDLLIHSNPHKTGRIDQSVLQTRDDLANNLPRCGFFPAFVATDGDNGVSKIHDDACNSYRGAEINVSLEVIVNYLTDNRAHYLKCWPISDFLHLLKNARTRIATGTLTFAVTAEELISAGGLNEILRLGKDLVASNPLDLLRDDLALRVFTLGNLMKLWSHKKMTGVYFLMPYVALNLAIRNDLLSRATRLHLIQVAFSIFFRMLKDYPATGQHAGIYEKGADPSLRKTLWTVAMCTRACNLCVGLYWAIETFDCLPLGRIGTHSVECHFGTTRSMLRGDTRWDHFLGREVDSILAQKIMRELNLKPYIRRFMGISGSVIRATDDPNLITVSFEDIPQRVEAFAVALKHGAAAMTVFDRRSILLSFEELNQKLFQAGHKEEIDRPGLTGGLAIMGRFFAGSSQSKLEEENIAAIDPNVAEQLVVQHADDEIFTS
jgi:hypothetical protein